MEQRKDETRSTWFRSERIFRTRGEWYIQTREGVDVGPFPTKSAAKAETKALLETLEVTRPEDVEAAVQGYLLNAQPPTGDVCEFTDYVVKEGSF